MGDVLLSMHMTTKAWKITYYVLTALLTLLMLPGGYFDLIQAPDAVAIFAHLGYPAYLSTILGAAKILGVIGIWQPKWPMLREWAYAGFFFDTFGALLSQFAVGDEPAMYGLTAIAVVLVLASYASMRKIKWQ
jgi:hypothetical protein